MTLAYLLLLFIFPLQDQIPLKPNDEFEVKMNFEFKERTSTSDPNKVELDPNRSYERKRGTGPLPYLFINVHVLKAIPEEVRVRVIENGTKSALNKKFDVNTILKLDLGFTDDIKDRVSAYQYTIIFLNDNKIPTSRIEVMFQEDGTYLVNGQVRGKI